MLDGKTACVQVAPARLSLPDGPFTVEPGCAATTGPAAAASSGARRTASSACWRRTAVLRFSVFLGDRYATAKSAAPVLRAGTWHHIAGVFDGREVRAYVDGVLVGSAPGSGARRPNDLPLFVGADPTGKGKPGSWFRGRIDDVRVSKVARYQGERFVPPTQLLLDADTVLALPCDVDFGPWTADASPLHRHPLRLGTAHCTLEDRPGAR
ncbi:MAG: LamG domain-containing protein [Planctomycetota bacterium]